MTGEDRALALWRWIDGRLSDGPDNRNNRFAVAAEMARQYPGLGPFWGRPATVDEPDIPVKARERSGDGHPPERRLVDGTAKGAKTVWQLAYAGSVGSQVITGLPAILRLRDDPDIGDRVRIWPFETGLDVPDTPVVVAEIYPSLLKPDPGEPIKDAGQVRAVANWLRDLDGVDLLAPQFLGPSVRDADRVAIATEEAWILGMDAAGRAVQAEPLGGGSAAADVSPRGKCSGVVPPPTLPRKALRYERNPAEIYRQSFAIVEREARLDHLPPDLRDVAIRLVHACGMPDITARLAWSADAAASAISALRNGAPILCDCEAVASMVIRRSLPAGNPVVCTLNEACVAGRAAEIGNTRSAAAVELWAERMAGAVVAIGNAPTALFRLLELLDDGAPSAGGDPGVSRRLRGRGGIQGRTGGRSARCPVPDPARPARRIGDGGGRRECLGATGWGRLMSKRWLTIIGIGEDGMAGLSAAARAAIEGAEVIVGGDRHHDLAPNVTAERLRWPHPFSALIEELVARRDQRPVVLATGDPLWFSVGARIARAIPPEEITFHPALSAFQHAACRMGWSLADAETLTAHGRPPEQVVPYFWPGARLLVLTAGAETPGALARLLTARGYGASRITVLGALGGPRETRQDGIAADWAAEDPVAEIPAFHSLAIECLGTPDVLLPRVPGLPDDAFEHDGKLTKREVRAATLSRLMPARGAVLWDIGVGCGSVAIEWMRAAPDAVAVGIDPRPDRLAMAGRNAMALGAPRLHLVEGAAPAALAEIPAPKGTSVDLRAPDAVFVGGGLSAEVFKAAWDRLPTGGRLVANAVTLETEAVMLALHAAHGGDLTRIAVQRAEPVGSMTGWRAAMPVTQWALVK